MKNIERKENAIKILFDKNQQEIMHELALFQSKKQEIISKISLLQQQAQSTHNPVQINQKIENIEIIQHYQRFMSNIEMSITKLEKELEDFEIKIIQKQKELAQSLNKEKVSLNYFDKLRKQYQKVLDKKEDAVATDNFNRKKNIFSKGDD